MPVAALSTPHHQLTGEPATPCQALRFVRHGATALNLAGLRCGGDLDVPLMPVGRAQALQAALAIAALRPAVGVIVTSHLQRTRETAEIIARHLNEGVGGVQGDVRVVVLPLFAERHLGAWNCLSIAQTQARLWAGNTPPAGESNDVFEARVAQALRSLAPWWAQRPLLVSSQGVARVLGQLAGWPAGTRLNNAQVVEFKLPSSLCDVEPLETV
jgi:2,3-bisphosphoglycerate-dependent phosphoglycerate mutase